MLSGQPKEIPAVQDLFILLNHRYLVLMERRGGLREEPGRVIATYYLIQASTSQALLLCLGEPQYATNGYPLLLGLGSPCQLVLLLILYAPIVFLVDTTHLNVEALLDHGGG
jgi:hypothetical protein